MSDPSYQLVLICSNSCEDCFRKDEGSVFLLLYISDGPVPSLASLYKVNPGLELVHRVEDHLKQIKLSKL